MSNVRVRFAPSPTGFLHIGGIRSALFNYLYAHKHNGTFILRLEDTDRERFVPEAEAHLVESLEWLGIAADEGIGAKAKGSHGPYVQSERLELYQKHATALVEQGKMYRCWCSLERLSSLRTKAQSEKRAFKYDRHCLEHPGDPGTPHVLRFKIPENQVVTWEDAVRGHIEFHSQDLDDFVAVKSDGFPTYQFANVIDDHEMQISHVLRADEWLPSTPKHLLLYAAFDWEPPVYAHLPAVTAPGGGKKLSKRHGAKSALELRDEGYLPEAIINFLALLGWNEGDGSTKEIYTKPELIKAFSLERVQKSPAVFDVERLNWLNGIHIRSLSIDELYKRAKNFWPKAAKTADEAYKKAVLVLVQERLKYLAELPELTDFFFTDLPLNAELITSNKQLGKLAPTELKSLLEAALQSLNESDFSASDLTKRLNALLESTDQKPAVLFSLIRIATTQSPASPGLADTLSVLGKEVSLRRISTQIAAL